MTEPRSVVDRLLSVQAGIAAIEKSNTTKATGSYKYRGIDDVMRVVHPLFVEHGVIVVPHLIDWEVEAHGGGVMDKIHVTYRAYGADGDHVEFQAIGIGLGNDDKSTGKGLSYALKCALLQLFSVPANDPSMDNEASDAQRPVSRRRSAPEPPLSEPVVPDDDPARRETLAGELRKLEPKEKRAAAANRLKGMGVDLKRPCTVAQLDAVEDVVVEFADAVEPFRLDAALDEQTAQGQEALL